MFQHTKNNKQHLSYAYLQFRLLDIGTPCCITVEKSTGDTEPKENAYTIYRSLHRVAVDTTENIESLAVQCDNVIMEKINY